MANRKVNAANKTTVDFKAAMLAEFTSIEAFTNETHGTINARRKAFIESMAAEYGAVAIREAKDGGIDGNKLKSDEGYKAEAGRLGITQAKLKEAVEIIAEIKKAGPFKWRDYLRAAFPAAKAEKAAKGAQTNKADKADKATKADKAEPASGPDIAELIAANPQEARKVLSIVMAALTENRARRKKEKGRTGHIDAAIMALQDACEELANDKG